MTAVRNSPPQLPLQLQPRAGLDPVPREPGVASPRKLSFVGLFAGIGGLERGLERAGHRSLLMCELDPAARAVLDSRFPSIPKHDDVTTLERLPDSTELLVAGFPCQDLSQAGRTAGIGGKNSGLIGHVFRLLESHDVPWLLLENVSFMLHLARGHALEVIVSRLERLGYSWAYRVVDSRAFGLPQRRQRLFLVASRVDDPRRVLFADETGEPDEPPRQLTGLACGFYWTEGIRGLGWAVDSVPTLKGGSTVGVPSPPAILLPSGEVVTPTIRDAERLQGFPADWTKAAAVGRKKGARWKLVGNAVSVPAAKWLGRRFARPGAVVPFDQRRLRPGEPWPAAAWSVGEGRHAAYLSMWPKRSSRRPLHEFLREPGSPLSARATAGFLKRTEISTLRFPEGFLPALAKHLERVSNEQTG